VLIVEDNAETRDVLKMLLEINGYDVALACDGAEALDHLRARRPVSLIILDLRMPVMDGWTFLREVQSDPQLAALPVIAFSANIEGEVPGTIATIRKATVDVDVFLALIERACVGKPSPIQ
jgi:CheY-like chemotaxis protein